MDDHSREEDLRARAQAEYERLKSDVTAARATAAPTANPAPPPVQGAPAPRSDAGVSEVSSAERASIGSLLSDISTHASTLVRGEIEHAQISLKEKITRLGMGGVLLGAAAFVALYMLTMLFVTLALVLAIWLPVWAGFAIVTALLLLVVALLALAGKRKLDASKRYAVGKGISKDVSAIKEGLKK